MSEAEPGYERVIPSDVRVAKLVRRIQMTDEVVNLVRTQFEGVWDKNFVFRVTDNFREVCPASALQEALRKQDYFIIPGEAGNLVVMILSFNVNKKDDAQEVRQAKTLIMTTDHLEQIEGSFKTKG